MEKEKIETKKANKNTLVMTWKLKIEDNFIWRSLCLSK